jgi:von Willebrand factor type A domain
MGALAIARNRDDENLEAQAVPEQAEEGSESLEISIKGSQDYIVCNGDSPSEVIGCLVLEGLAGPSKAARPGVDIVCIIDVSGSMEGKKLELVKTSLKFMLTQLDINDRVSLVTFSDDAERLCRFTVTNEKGKKRLEALINRLDTISSTEIVKGLELGLCVVAGRRYFNSTCAVILLSDGQDNSPSTSLTRANEVINKIPIDKDYTIHSFGYGSDHDSVLLSSISQTKNGGFYYIKKLKSIAEAFGNCLGEVISTVSDNIRVSLETQPCEVPFSVTKIFSETGDNTFKMPNILSGSKKEAVFLINIHPFDLNTEEITIKPVRATVTYRDTKLDVTKQVQIDFEVKLRREITDPIVQDKDVLINYYRFLAAESLKEAAELGNNRNLEDARAKIEACSQAIQFSPIADLNLAHVMLNDLEKSKKKFVDYESYSKTGAYAEIMEKIVSHKSKRGTDIIEYQNRAQTETICISNSYFKRNK